MKTLAEKITALHASPIMMYVATTGAGAGCQNILSSVPGASKTLLECLFPYSNEALVEFLGEIPAQFASKETAIKMAKKAWERGVKLASKRGMDPAVIIGLGLTAVVGTNRPLKGDHRVFAAVWRNTGVFAVRLKFEKGSDGFSLIGREKECFLSDLAAVNLLLFAAGIEQEQFEWQGILEGDICRRNGNMAVLNPRSDMRTVVYMPDGQEVSPDALSPDKHFLFCGSFNPLHDGHKVIAREVAAKTGKQVVYILNADHPIKGSLSDADIKNRVSQFAWFAPILVSRRTSLYIEMAEAFPGFDFVLGADALRNMLDPKYYNFSIVEMLRRFKRLGTGFYVARRDQGSGIVSPKEVISSIAEDYRAMFHELDSLSSLSSTKLRAGVR